MHHPKISGGRTIRASAIVSAVMAMICNCHVSVESFASPMKTEPKNMRKFTPPMYHFHKDGYDSFLTNRATPSLSRRLHSSNSSFRDFSPGHQQFHEKIEENNDDRGFYRKVAILIPNSPEDIGSQAWFPEALGLLQKLANHLALPMIPISTSAPAELTESLGNHYTHYLTIVPYPRINSFALVIHANPPITKNDNKSNARKKQRKLKLDPFFVDLCPPMDTRMGYRMNTINNKGNDRSNDSGSGGGELLLKALSWKKLWAEKNANNNGNDNLPLVIYDLTAGLARDTLIILAASFAANSLSPSDSDSMPVKVHMVERDPIVAALVKDATRRLKLVATTSIDRTESESAQTAEMTISDRERTVAEKLVRCLTMEECDATSFLAYYSSMTASQCTPSSTRREINSIPYPPDICYIDPMFPPRKKKSYLVKKDMAMLHSLLGTSKIHSTGGNDSNSTDYSSFERIEKRRVLEEQSLLTKACETAVKRVVVKRPIGAPPLGYLSGDDSDRKDCMTSFDSAATKDDYYGGVPKPSYDVRGSVNRWDVYICSSTEQD
ncbi:hypothetical protein ACHAXS_007559 [Conticribra weissflogii]